MLESIIILVGEINSGKSSTLRTLAEMYLGKPKGVNQRFFDYKGKGICIFPSSPQENSDNAFCHADEVIKDVEHRIMESNSRNCSLLVTTFTLKGSWKAHKLLNEGCIEGPIRELSSKFKVHIVYLRKDGERKSPKTPRQRAHAKQIKELMARLKPYEIESRQGTREEERQAGALWEFILKIDP